MSNRIGNYIPLGRQLPRTPPFAEVKKRLDFCDDDPNVDWENQDVDGNQTGSRDQNENLPHKTFDFITAETKSEPDDISMLKGMKGYQVTPSDLEFIQKMKEERLIKRLEGALVEILKEMKKETMVLELLYDSREKAQAELEKFPSCEELIQWVKLVLGTKLPSAEFSDLDAKCLLALVRKEDVQKVVDEKRMELVQMRKMVENKRKKEAQEKERLEKQIAREQIKIQGLMSQLSNLKSELAQQEEVSKTLEMQINSQEAPQIRTEIENVDASVEVKYVAKERKKTIKAMDKLQNTTNPSKSRNKLVDNYTSIKDRTDKSTNRTLTTTQKSEWKAARGSQKKFKEGEANPGSESDVTGQRKPPGTGQTTSQQKNKGKAGADPKQKAAPAAEEAGLRRSKRIASRR